MDKHVGVLTENFVNFKNVVTADLNWNIIIFISFSTWYIWTYYAGCKKYIFFENDTPCTSHRYTILRIEVGLFETARHKICC